MILLSSDAQRAISVPPTNFDDQVIDKAYEEIESLQLSEIYVLIFGIIIKYCIFNIGI